MHEPVEFELLEQELGPKRALALAIRTRENRRLIQSFKEPDGRGLYNFIQYYWDILEPDAQMMRGWALLAMCKYLAAVSDGRITRLLINVPPGSMKSLLVNVFWPAWEWLALGKTSMRYISFSYGSHLTERDNEKFGDILASKKTQELFPWFELRARGKQKVSNYRTGFKFATSVGGVGTGERGDRVLLDDPHNVKEAESDTVRTETVRWFREAMSNRLNNMEKSAIIVIMQRVHEDDVSGNILAEELGYVHLMIPLEFEPDRRTVTYLPPLAPAGANDVVMPPALFWADPRTVEGQCFWPERFPAKALAEIKLLGEHAVAGQYQQRPEPRGGGLFKRAYWRRYPMPDAQFPRPYFVVASLDGAFTEKKENDPCGFTCWGAFIDDEGNKSAITLTAWRKHLPLHKNVRDKEPAESWVHYKHETQEDWGLIQWLHYECRRWGGVNKLLIENKANGLDVSNEMLRLFSWAKFVVELCDPKQNDKFARAIAVQPVFAEGLIYTIDENLKRQWPETLITDMALFPRGRFDDLVDSTTQAVKWLRKNGMLIMAEERRQQLIQDEEYRQRLMPLYAC